MFLTSYNRILYSNINKLFTWSIAGVSKGNRGKWLFKNLNVYVLLCFKLGSWFSTHQYEKKRKVQAIILLSREEISSRKALQAGELHSQLVVRPQHCPEGREIPAAFTHHTRCTQTLRSLTTGVEGHKLASASHLWLRRPAPWRSSKS